MDNKKETLIEILLVEDNAGDVELTREAFAEVKARNRIHVASDGVKALSFLRKTDGYENVPSPDIILLDLNLPKKTGLEVLMELKNDSDLKKIPVVILTTSQADEDIYKSYNYHANCYISKPVDFEKFLQVIKSLDDFWLAIVKLPSSTRNL